MKHSERRIPANRDVQRNGHRLNIVSRAGALKTFPSESADSNRFGDGAYLTDNSGKGVGVEVVIVIRNVGRDVIFVYFVVVGLSVAVDFGNVHNIIVDFDGKGFEEFLHNQIDYMCETWDMIGFPA